MTRPEERATMKPKSNRTQLRELIARAKTEGRAEAWILGGIVAVATCQGRTDVRNYYYNGRCASYGGLLGLATKRDLAEVQS